MLLSDAINLFFRRCKLMGLSKVTIKDYETRLGMFMAFIGDVDLSLLTRSVVDNYSIYLFDKDISKYSIRSYLIDVRTFLNFLRFEGLAGDLTSHLHIPKTSKKLVTIYTPAEIQAIFDSLKIGDNDVLRSRNYGIVALMYDSGLRRSEVLELRIRDINFERKIAKVHGKGDKYRFVPLGDMTVAILRQYLAYRVYTDSEYLFLVQTGDPLTPEAIKSLFRRIRLRSGVDVSAHKLRHNFATNFLVNQYDKYGHADIYQLQVILGHSDTKTTLNYLHIANQIIACRTSNSHLDSLNLTLV